MRWLWVLLVGVGCEGTAMMMQTDAGVPDVAPRIDAALPSGCVDEARWVYVVDEDRTLIRFEPDALRFVPLGTLGCDPTSFPFSMAVDRDANAWVLYQNGRLFRVSTTDATCTTTPFVGQAGFDLFGMGFAGNLEGGETLFVSGGREAGISTGDARLASIDVGTMMLTPRGEVLPGWPELTGTGDGELWAFFPQTTPPTASRLDRDTAQPVETYRLESIPEVRPTAWAFAFWGGRFYVFLQTLADSSSQVWRLDPETGAVEHLLSSGYRIVGAGVSTCAPTKFN